LQFQLSNECLATKNVNLPVVHLEKITNKGAWYLAKTHKNIGHMGRFYALNNLIFANSSQ